MDYAYMLDTASKEILQLKWRNIPAIEIAKPASLEYARELAKAISKLSPLLGDLIEISIIDILNNDSLEAYGHWQRQGPGFPNAVFQSDIVLPNPGLEIKAWSPFEPEIAFQFNDSISRFEDGQINVALVAWMPEFVIWGKPLIVDAWVGSASSVAASRDAHYHNPPEYLVFEPEGEGLQQASTEGYKFHGSLADFLRAKQIVDGWGANGRSYSSEREYQLKLKRLIGGFAYRLDANFAKMDRISCPSLEGFKLKVLDTEYCGAKIQQWPRILSRQGDGLDRELIKLIKG